VLYTFKPIVSPPDAGPDQIVCSGDSVQIGVPPLPGDAYSYTWFPATGLSNTAVSNPKVRLTNDLPTPVTYTYFVTKDSSVNENLCAYSDAMQITVLGKAAQAGADLTVCSGEKRILYSLPQSGYQYSWRPATGLSNADIYNPEIKLQNYTNQPVTYQYILRATHSTSGCATEDTLNVTVLPQVARAGPDIEFCTGESRQLGGLSLPNHTYRWQPATGLSNANIANPTITLNHTGSSPQTFTYILQASAAGGCTDTDTVSVTVLPPLAQPVISGPKSVCPNVTNVMYRVTNMQPSNSYRWDVSGGTIKSGQGSSQVEVDWGPTNAAAKIIVTSSNSADCIESSSSLLVNINVVLTTEKPVSVQHPDTLCMSAATGIVYEVPNTTGSVYTWGVSGNGTITNGQGTNRIIVNWLAAGSSKVWVNEQSTTSSNICFGTSDTLDILIAPMPQATFQVTGNSNVCAGTSQNYRIEGYPGSAFIWKVTGGTIISQQENTLTVNWQPAGSGTVTVQEVTQFGCEGKVVETKVAVLPVPTPQLISQDVAICPQRYTGLTYQVAGLPGSGFSWRITNGQIIASTADSSTITVNWDPGNLSDTQLVVTETSVQNCSAALTVPLLYDASTIVLKSVSVQPEDERNIIVRFNIANAPSLVNQFTISKRALFPEYGDWNIAGTVTTLDSFFVDKNLSTDDQSYEYKIEGNNLCGIPLEAGLHHSILLNVTGNEEKELTEMSWNSYTGWESGVKTYEIWRKLDDEAEYSLYTTLNSNQLSYAASNAKEGFIHCYRIRAIENSGFKSNSWSNEVCIEYVHPLFIPNVITPNGDKKNDFWVIENLELYPQHQVFIYNRSGKEIYRTNAYRQDWNSEGLTNGMYYYLIRTRRNNQSFKGWLHVIR
jgi:gliding motility-associated-like protein